MTMTIQHELFIFNKIYSFFSSRVVQKSNNTFIATCWYLCVALLFPLILSNSSTKVSNTCLIIISLFSPYLPSWPVTFLLLFAIAISRFFKCFLLRLAGWSGWAVWSGVALHPSVGLDHPRRSPRCWAHPCPPQPLLPGWRGWNHKIYIRILSEMADHLRVVPLWRGHLDGHHRLLSRGQPRACLGLGEGQGDTDLMQT